MSPDLVLPDKQDALISAVAAANRNTLVNARNRRSGTDAVARRRARRASGLVSRASAAARPSRALVFGDVNPGGRLPMTFPASASQPPRPTPPKYAEQKALDAANIGKKPGTEAALTTFPIAYREGADVGYRWYEREGLKPLFPFGFGLSYTGFRYGGLKVEDGAALTVSFDVTNIGKVAGADVPQVYVEATGSAGTTTRRLAGFRRVTLAPGETRRVSVAVDPRTIARFDTAAPGWVVAAGDYKVTVGRFASDSVLNDVAKLQTMRLSPGEPWPARR